MADDPFKPKPLRGSAQPRHRALKIIVSILVGLVSFALGCFATLFVLLRMLAPQEHCPSPCDAPVYVAMGMTMLVAPVVGTFFAVAGVHALARLWPRRGGAPGRPR